MKHFVYLDTDLIYSYLSQIDDGLIKTKGEEVASEVSEEKIEENTPSKKNTTFGAALHTFMKYEQTNVEEFNKQISSISHTNAGKELITKILHDNSYDNLIDHLVSTESFIDFNDEYVIDIGSYVNLKDKFKMVDLSIFQNLLGEEFRKVYKSLMSGNLEQAVAGLNREARRDLKKSKSTTDTKSKIDSEIKTFEDVLGMILYIAKLLPSDKYIIYKDMLIPLDKKYLREDYNSLRYKYSNDSIIVGHITGCVSDIMDFSMNTSGVLDPVIKSLDELLLSAFDMLSIRRNFKIMHPISWYYE